MNEKNEERFLKSGEVAQMFRVNPSTLMKWARSGKIPHIKTPGGQRRYRETDVLALLNRGEDN